MTAAIYNMRDYQSKKAVKPEPKSIEETLAGIISAALAETDTAPSEYCAPDKDPA